MAQIACEVTSGNGGGGGGGGGGSGGLDLLLWNRR
jgi:hypothetical protein